MLSDKLGMCTLWFLCPKAIYILLLREIFYDCLQVCNFNSATCGSFQALTQRGYLTANIQNKGFANADYLVTVSNCTQSVLPVVAQVSAAFLVT